MTVDNETVLLNVRQARRRSRGLACLYRSVLCMWKKFITCTEKGYSFLVTCEN
jgi:hypothetical protein